MAGLTLLSYPASLTAAKMIVRGAANEIRLRKLDGAEAFAVRGAALRALDELYHDGLTESARNRYRRTKPPKGVVWVTGREALVSLAGWDEMP